MNPRKNKRHEIYPEVRPYHKGVLLPVEEPTKGRVFSNPNHPQAKTPKQPHSVKELEGSKNNKFTQEVFAKRSRDGKKRGEEN